MRESGQAMMKKATSKASTTAEANRLCARPGDKVERMKSCSFRTTTAVFTIAATLRSGWNARHEAHTASPLLSHAASVRRHFCPLGRLTTTVAASEKAGLVRFPAAAQVISPMTDLNTFSLHLSL